MNDGEQWYCQSPYIIIFMLLMCFDGEVRETVPVLWCISTLGGINHRWSQRDWCTLCFSSFGGISHSFLLWRYQSHVKAAFACLVTEPTITLSSRRAVTRQTDCHWTAKSMDRQSMYIVRRTTHLDLAWNVHFCQKPCTWSATNFFNWKSDVESRVVISFSSAKRTSVR